MGAGTDVIGIDVDEVAVVVGEWRSCRRRLVELTGRAAGRAAALALDASSVSASADETGRGLVLCADLLERRAAAMAGIAWPGGDAGGGWGWGWARAGPAGGDPYDDLSGWLAAGRRGYLVSELVEPTAEEWAAMVAAGTRVDGNRTMRYFDIAADPGGGVLVVDFFIPDSNSVFAQGDRRGHEDPIFGDVTDSDSRMVIVFDLESGRGTVQFDETCLTGGMVCNEARPIEMDGAEVVWSPSADWEEYALPGAPLPVDLLEIPNQVSVDSRPGWIDIDYDVLNGIIPVGSVDGTITLASDGAGRYRVEEMDVDRYPSIGIYQYRFGEHVDVLDQQDSKGMLYAFPWLGTAIDATRKTVTTAVDATVVGVDVAAEATTAVVDAGIDMGSAAVDIATETAADVAGGIGDLAGGIGDVFGGGIEIPDEWIEEYCAESPEEPACDDVGPHDD